MLKLKLLLFVTIISIFLVTCIEDHILPNFGSIYLTSDPIGAEIYSNGIKTNKVTPDSLTELLNGEYNITLKKNEFVDSSFVFNVNEGTNYSKNIFLKESDPKGNITLTTIPEGSQIYLNGKNTNRITPSTFENLERGEYLFKLTQDLFDDYNLNVDLDKDESITKNVRMIIAGTSGILVVRSTPSNAQILLSEDNITFENSNLVTPDTVKPLPSGNYFVKLSLDNYRDTVVTADVIPGVVTEKNVNLTFYEPRGSIQLDSEPQGAQIFIDDTNTGLITPNTINKVKGGEYNITFKLSSYFDSTFTVNVIEDQKTIHPKVALKKIPYSISVTIVPDEGGSVTGAGSYFNGEEAVLKATPNTGYNFINWTDVSGELSTEMQYSFTVSENRDITANFELKSYTISATTNPNGSGIISGTGTYQHGENVTINVTANDGYKLINWTEESVEVTTEAEFSFIAENDRNLIANYEEIGNLVINSDPQDADIYLNGISTGEKTPKAFSNITAGEYSITLKLQDFADTTIVTDVFKGATTNIGPIILRENVPDVVPEVTYVVNTNNQLIFTFSFNQDIKFGAVSVKPPTGPTINQNYFGQLVPQGFNINWNYPEKIDGTWKFTFTGSQVIGRENNFEVITSVDVN